MCRFGDGLPLHRLIVGLQGEPVFAACNYDALGVAATGTSIKLVEPAAELMDVDPDDCVLGHVEVRSPSQSFDRNVDLLGRLSQHGALDEIVEQAAELAGTSQQTARPDAVGTRGELFGIQH